MLARSEGLKVSIDNISDAKNMLSVAEGGLTTMTDIMIAMRTQAEKAASDTLGTAERATIQTQLSSYSSQIQDLVDQTRWNGVKLLDNSTGAKTFQTGVDEGETTVWGLPQALDPGSMALSKKVYTPTVTSSDTASSFTKVGALGPVETSSTLANLSELSTGDYNFSILNKASSATLGKTNLDINSTLISGMTGLDHSTVEADIANALSSGKYSFEIIQQLSATNISYKITKTGDTSFGNNGVLTVNNADLSGSAFVAPVAQSASITTPSSPATVLGVNFTPTMGNLSPSELTTGAYTIQFFPNQTNVRLTIRSGGSEVEFSEDPEGNAAMSIGSELGVIGAGTGTYNTGRGLIINWDKGPANSFGIPLDTVIQYTQASAGSGAVAGPGDLVDGSGNALGINIGTNLSSLAVGQKMDFEYIAKNEAKFALEDDLGQAVQVAQNASGAQNGFYGYGAADAIYNSGRGVNMKLGAFNNIATGAGGEQNFSYKRANLFSVNVSNTHRAGAYLTTVNTALDRVNSALSDLGALTARLTFKEQQSSVSQINIEGAYCRIMNANMAEEQANASKYSILQQTAIAMLAQANMAPRSLLSLFR